MNIFFIDKCPIKSAQQLCDKHVVKMVLETAQMCSTAMHYWDQAKHMEHVYKSAYVNHPMTVWVRDNVHNLAWAVIHGLAIGREYTYRYGKNHKSTNVLEEINDYTIIDTYIINVTINPVLKPALMKNILKIYKEFIDKNN